MKFLVNGVKGGLQGGLRGGIPTNNILLKIILFFTLLYILFLSATNILLYIENIGFTRTSVVDYYLGSEEEFKAPVSYRGLLETTHFHLFAIGMALLLVCHLTVFTNLPQKVKLFFILISFIFWLCDMASGWLLRFISPSFAYLKIVAFVISQISLIILTIFSFLSLNIYNVKK